MEILQANKFKLLPKLKQSQLMKQFAGSCRFVWNKALELEQNTYESTKKRLGYVELAAELVKWKSEDGTLFLSDVHSQALQQSLKDLDRAYDNFFQGRAEFPKYKKRGEKDSFRYPQGFKMDEKNARIYLPKIGWVRYKQSRLVLGTPKQVTVSLYCGEWYISVQTAFEIEDPVHNSTSSIGIDMGITHFATLSDGTHIESLNIYRKYERKLSRELKALSRKKKYSSNWYKQKRLIQRLHKRVADIRRNHLHQESSRISKNHALVVMEDLKVSNMSRSASGSVENPGRNVSSKSGLNKAILDQGWYEFRRQLEYKLKWRGGRLILVAPQYTSQRCSVCGHTSSSNRQSQSKFECESCGMSMNADVNAARNILAAGHAVTACEVGSSHGEART